MVIIGVHLARTKELERLPGVSGGGCSFILLTPDHVPRVRIGPGLSLPDPEAQATCYFRQRGPASGGKPRAGFTRDLFCAFILDTVSTCFSRSRESPSLPPHILLILRFPLPAHPLCVPESPGDLAPPHARAQSPSLWICAFGCLGKPSPLLPRLLTLIFFTRHLGADHAPPSKAAWTRGHMALSLQLLWLFLGCTTRLCPS